MLPHVAASSLAAFTSAFIKVPADVLKARVQAYVYPDFPQAVRGIMHSQGLRG